MKLWISNRRAALAVGVSIKQFRAWARALGVRPAVIFVRERPHLFWRVADVERIASIRARTRRVPVVTEHDRARGG